MVDYDKHLSKCELWQFLKLRIKEASIIYCINKTKSQKDCIKNFEYELDKIDKDIALCASNETELLKNKRMKVKQELDSLYANKAVGAQIRSRAKWIEKGEKSTSYFLNLEKNRQTFNNIQSLKYKGKESHNDTDILEICKDFYNDLYASRNLPKTEIKRYMSKLKMPKKLTSEQISICDGKINTNECDKVIKDLKKNKSPGLDGITAEFYQQFWPDIKNIVVNAFNESYDLGSLPESMRVAVMSLIFKKGDTEDLENYRPISITNLDYKILAFALANRVQKVIYSIIHPDQVAYIKQRFIGTNIRLVLDVIENATDGLLVFLDFKKAFDSIEWNFIFESLNQFNFGDSFIKWIKLLYNKPQICIKNNGHLSEQFEIYKGVRQGCPISCLIFILCVEILAESIRQNKEICGIKLDKSYIKICQYADDATIFLQNEQELHECIQIINMFNKNSGMALNMSKSEGLWLGRSKHRQKGCNTHGIKWPSSPIKYLGIHIGYNTDECNRLNWYRKIDKLKGILESWKTQRNLTLFGKVQVIKCLAMAGLIYTATNCELPSDRIIYEINKEIYEFLWGTTEKIKRNVLINPKSEGGIDMIHVKSQFEALKAMWAIRLLKNKDDFRNHWLELPNKYLDRLGDNQYVLNAILDEKIVFRNLSCIPMFYQQMVLAFSKYMTVKNTDNMNTDPLKEPIFGNRNITYTLKKKKHIPYFVNWINSGLKYVKDLRINNGKIDSGYIYEKVFPQTNIHNEIAIVMKSLKPLIKNISNDPTEPSDHNNDLYWRELNDNKTINTKFFYIRLIKQLQEKSYMEDFWNKTFDMEIPFKEVYTKKILDIKDKKLAETNLKMIHGILPCAVNLKRWKKKRNDKCDICNSTETISHLIYECQYARIIWSKVEKALNSTINPYNVILGHNLAQNTNMIISLIAYLIYKEWVNMSLNNKQRQKTPNMMRYACELEYKKQIYCETNVLSIYGNLIDDVICQLLG